MEISLLVIRFLYLGTSVIYVVRNRAYWSSSDSSSKPKPGNSIVTTRTNTIKLFWLYSLALSSLPLLFGVSAGLPSAIRQRWWRIHWTLFGRLLKSPFELFATVIMTGMSLFLDSSYYGRLSTMQRPRRPSESSRGVLFSTKGTQKCHFQ